jgi:hypothetical protein
MICSNIYQAKKILPASLKIYFFLIPLLKPDLEIVPIHEKFLSEIPNPIKWRRKEWGRLTQRHRGKRGHKEDNFF